MSASRVDNLSFNVAQQQTAIVAGPAGNFDEGGVWITSAEYDQTSGKVRAWYHAERNNTLPNTSHWSMAYAESWDLGQTFSRVPSADNRVLTAPGADPPPPGAGTGEGNGSVIRWGDKYLMYFTHNPADPYDNTTRLAQSNIASGGERWTWSKYLSNGDGIISSADFASDALGGLSTMLQYPGPVSRDTLLLGSFAGSYWGSTSGSPYVNLLVTDVWTTGWPKGVKLSYSADTINFTAMPQPLLVSDGMEYARAPSDPPPATAFIDYASIVAPTGGSAWEKSFHMFYEWIPTFTKFDRYLERRLVQVSRNASGISPQVDVALTRYYSPTFSDHWVTTAPPRQAGAQYDFEKDIGYVLTSPQPGTVRLTDCYAPGWHDHYVGPGDLSQSPCGTTDQVLGTIGWAWTTPAVNRKPIYRCFSATLLDHVIAETATCDNRPGYSLEWGAPMGYINRADKTLLTRFYSSARTDTWVLTQETHENGAGHPYSYLPSDYAFDKDLGFLFSPSEPQPAGTVAIHSCYYPDDHFLYPYNCAGLTDLGLIGYIYDASAAQPPGTKKLYRCYNVAQANHTVSDDPFCESATPYEFVLGYTEL